MKKMVRGELTVFLSFVFLLLLALVGAVLESASIQMLKNEKRADASMATESVFAEYQRDLLENYHIFALEESYESGEVSEEHILNRLRYYGAENMDMDIAAIGYLTDENGQEFFRQAVEYQKKKTGFSMLESAIGNYSVWKEKEKLTEEYGKEDIKTSEEMDQVLQEEEETLASEQNPLELLKEMKSDLFFKLVLPEQFELSSGQINTRDVPSKRKIQEGYGTLFVKEEEAKDIIFFNLYAMEHFENARKKIMEEEKSGKGLVYEVEYLLEGKESDAANLEGVARKICNIRFGINYAYLLSSQEKQMEAEAMAGTLCALLISPEIVPLVKHALLLTWAYGEGMVDVKTLLDGGRVPLMKSDETWHLSLENLFSMKENGIQNEDAEQSEGENYERYLQMLLLAKQKNLVTMRALDIVEQDIRRAYGKEYFRADACVTGATFHMTCPMRRSITYQFTVGYQYH